MLLSLRSAGGGGPGVGVALHVGQDFRQVVRAGGDKAQASRIEKQQLALRVTVGTGCNLIAGSLLRGRCLLGVHLTWGETMAPEVAPQRAGVRPLGTGSRGWE